MIAVPSRERPRGAPSLLAVALGTLLASCGGGPSGPTPVPTPTPPTDVHDVIVVVFYDENGNGRLDESERARVPNVTVAVGSRTAKTEKLTGRAVVTAVPAGTQPVTLRALPPFFVPPPPRSVTVPTSADALVPATLRIGDNRPNVYMAFGDSITLGEGSSDGNGYVEILEAQLRDHFGRASVINRGDAGTRSTEGVERIPRNLRLIIPAYTLVQYGTNDWIECKGAVPCVTIDSLRTIVQTVKGARSLPCLATIIPANPDRNPPERNVWVKQIDVLIRDLARDEGAVLVDLEAAFLREGSLPALFSDHVHPNDRGYRVIADEFFRAITEAEPSDSAFEDVRAGLAEPWSAGVMPIAAHPGPGSVSSLPSDEDREAPEVSAPGGPDPGVRLPGGRARPRRGLPHDP